MDPQSTPQQSTPPQSTQQSHFSLFLGLLALSFFLSTLLLGYQNRQLNTEIGLLKKTQILNISPSPGLIWKTYTDTKGEYQFQYPYTYTLETFAQRPLLNRTITWYEAKRDPNQKCPDCPFVETRESKLFPFGEATKVTGYVGDLGGGIPQSFIHYEILKPGTQNSYLIFELWELPQNLDITESKQYQAGRTPGVISEKASNEFEQILSTLQFLSNK